MRALAWAGRREGGVVIVDAHVHVLPESVGQRLAEVRAADPWFAACHREGAAIATPDSLLASMDGAGIDRAICFTWPFADAGRCAESNDFLAALMRRHPDRIIGFGIVQPADPGAAAEVLRCARLGLRGVGELNADAQGWSLEDEAAVGPVARAAVEAGLPLTLHCSEPVGHLYAGKGTATPQRVASLAARHPDVQLVCAHLGGGLPFYAHMPEVRALCRTLWFDTAAVPFLYDATAYRAAVDGCGAGRILFGSDHPLLDASRYLPAMARQLSVEELAMVTGGAAATLLGI